MMSLSISCYSSSTARLQAACALLAALLGAVVVPDPAQADAVQVRYSEGTNVDPPTDPLTPSLLASVDAITPLFTLSAAQLGALRVAGEGLPRPNPVVQIALPARHRRRGVRR